jgi:hypothetical protein
MMMMAKMTALERCISEQKNPLLGGTHIQLFTATDGTLLHYEN